MKKKYIEESIYTKIMNWTYWALLANLAFTILNLPLLFVIIRFPFSLKWLPLYLATSLFFFPASVALFSCLSQFNETKDFQLRTFFYSFKQTLPKSLPIATINLVLILLIFLGTGLTSLSPYQKIIVLAFYFLCLLFLLFSTTYYYLLAKNQSFTFGQLSQSAFYLSLKKWYISLVNSVLYLVLYLTLFIKPAIGFLILPVLITSLLYANSQFLLKKQDGEAKNEKI